MITQKIDTIFENVKKLFFLQQITWLIAIVAENKVYYQKFSEENQFGDPSFFEKTLFFLQNPLSKIDQVQDLRKELEKDYLLHDTEEFGTLSASLAINSCVLADYALAFLENKDVDHLKKVIESHFETAEMLYSQDLDPNLRFLAWESALCAKTDFKQFLQKEEKRVEEISKKLI